MRDAIRDYYSFFNEKEMMWHEKYTLFWADGQDC